MFSFPEPSTIDGILLGIPQGRFVFFSNRLVPLNRGSRRAAESWLDWTGFEEAGLGEWTWSFLSGSSETDGNTALKARASASVWQCMKATHLKQQK